MTFRALFIFFFILSGCDTEDLITSDLTGIKVLKGMSLVGIVSDSDTKLPIQGVVVSDGYSATETDKNGVYQLKKHKNARHVFYSIPAEYEVLVDADGLPVFYDKILTSYDIYRKDFELTKLPGGIENNFTLICVADPQVGNVIDMEHFQTETIKDLKIEADYHEISYGITLGDLVADRPHYFGEIKRNFGETGTIFFHTIGNHDHYEGVDNDLDAIKFYEDCFGPVNYSFNRGNTHIVVLDNIIYLGNFQGGKRVYSIGFTQDQISWLRDNLMYVSKDKLIIVCVHGPVSETPNSQFYELISPYNEVHIMSGHRHLNANVWLEDYGIYEHITGAACGIWWDAIINCDGTPNGYGVYEIEGNSIVNWYYKATNFQKDFQIRMYPPYSFNDPTGNIVANVWNADDSWTVELFEDGVKTGDMERFTDFDKCAFQLFNSLKDLKDNRYKQADHLYKMIPHSFNSTVLVKATDRFGNVYTQDHFTSSTLEIENYEIGIGERLYNPPKNK